MSSMLNQLAQLRLSLEGCETLALVDLTTRMVLCAATGDRVPREQMDQLGQSAGLLLAGEVAQALARAEAEDSAQGEKSAVLAAVILSGEETEVFLRAGEGEALCAHGGAALAPESLFDAAGPILARLAEPDAEAPAGEATE